MHMSNESVKNVPNFFKMQKTILGIIVCNEALLLQKLDLGLKLEPQNQALAWLDSKLDNPNIEKLENLRLVAPYLLLR